MDNLPHMVYLYKSISFMFDMIKSYLCLIMLFMFHSYMYITLYELQLYDMCHSQ